MMMFVVKFLACLMMFLSQGYDRDEYNRLMQVDGQVMIARFALQQFWILILLD